MCTWWHTTPRGLRRSRAFRTDAERTRRCGRATVILMRVHARRVVASGALIAAATLAIAALKPLAPVISLGALYIVVVLAAAVLWGLHYAVAVSIVSMLVFNWFFLPPVHTFDLEEPSNWTALLVYL